MVWNLTTEVMRICTEMHNTQIHGSCSVYTRRMAIPDFEIIFPFALIVKGQSFYTCMLRHDNQFSCHMSVIVGYIVSRGLCLKKSLASKFFITWMHCIIMHSLIADHRLTEEMFVKNMWVSVNQPNFKEEVNYSFAPLNMSACIISSYGRLCLGCYNGQGSIQPNGS